MAQNKLNPEDFSCGICLDLLNDPVTIPCGHSYCRSCVQIHWDEEDHKQVYNCPQCRQSFSTRPVLRRSTMLAAVVEHLNKTELTEPSADQYAGPQDVSCDICTERKLRAVKSCLQCVASYCETHLQSHYEAAVLQKHQLVAPSNKLLKNTCPQHHRVKKMFSRTAQHLICSFCSVGKNKGHDTVSAAAERAQRQEALESRRAQLLQTIQDKETDLKSLQQEAQDIDRSAQDALQLSGDSFTEMIHLLEVRRSEVEQQIRSQQETELRRVQELQEELQQNITEIKKTISEIETLSLIEDHSQFLHNFPSLSTDVQSPQSPRIYTAPSTYFEEVTLAVSVLLEKMKTILQVDVLLTERKDFLKYSREITLDPNTAYTRLVLSEDNTRATFTEEDQPYHLHRDRFSFWRQVLSREGLTGRCYWEVEWSGEEAVQIAVAYKGIRKNGDSDQCRFGNNDKSWMLECDQDSYSFSFNKVQTEISGPTVSRIGVYLDHSAGALSFYGVSESMTLLHRVQSTFTQPLYVGLGFNWFGDTAYFPKM